MKTFKLSKTVCMVLIIGVLVVAFGILGVARANQVQEQQRLEDELSMAETRLSKIQIQELRSQKDELEEQMEKVVSELGATRDNLRQSIDSITVVESLFAVAEASGVEITDVSSTPLSSGNLEGVECSTIQLSMNVDGDVPNLIDFVISLNNDFVTGVVRAVQMDIQEYEDMDGESGEEPLQEEEEPAEEEKIPSVNIRMIVYSYQGE